MIKGKMDSDLNLSSSNILSESDEAKAKHTHSVGNDKIEVSSKAHIGEACNKTADSEVISLKEIILKLLDWWKYLFSKKYLVLTIGLIGGLCGFIYNYLKEPTYIAELTFVLENGNQEGGLGNYSGLATQFGINMGTGGGNGVFEGENLLALMRSRSMIEKALFTTVNVKEKSITLAEFYIDINNLRETWAKEDPKLNNVKFLPGTNLSSLSNDQNSLLRGFHSALISKYLVIDKQDKKSSIISLKVESENELFSKYFAEILAKEVSKFYVETKTKKSADNLRILQHQTDSIRRSLTTSMLGVASSTDANPNPNSAMQVLRVPSQRRLVDVQANQAILTQLVQNLEIAKVSLRTETPLIQVIDRPVLPLPKKGAGMVRGIILGGLLAGFLVVSFLIVSRMFKKIMA